LGQDLGQLLEQASLQMRARSWQPVFGPLRHLPAALVKIEMWQRKWIRQILLALSFQQPIDQGKEILT
jgi:hypothetical protein